MHNGTRIDVGASGGQWNGEWRTLADDCVTGFGLSVCIGGLALSLGLVAFTFLNCKRQHQHRRRFLIIIIIFIMTFSLLSLQTIRRSPAVSVIICGFGIIYLYTFFLFCQPS